MAHACQQSGVNIGEPHGTGIVEMTSQPLGPIAIDQLGHHGLHCGRVRGPNGVGNHQPGRLMLHEALNLLEHARLWHGPLIRALKRHRKIGVDRHPLFGGPVENLLTHHKSLFKTLANIVLVHLLGRGERDCMRRNAGTNREFIAFHIGYQRTVG